MLLDTGRVLLSLSTNELAHDTTDAGSRDAAASSILHLQLVLVLLVVVEHTLLVSWSMLSLCWCTSLSYPLTYEY